MPRRSILIGLAILELLLMGAAFVGGRMVGQQNSRGNRGQFAVQLPSQLPRTPAAGTGTVQKVQDTQITIARRGGGGQGGAAGANNQVEIAVSADTKYYKNVTTPAPGNPQGGPAPLQVQDAALSDVKVGGTVMVWGVQNGSRITAEVIYIQTSGR